MIVGRDGWRNKRGHYTTYLFQMVMIHPYVQSVKWQCFEGNYGRIIMLVAVNSIMLVAVNSIILVAVNSITLVAVNSNTLVAVNSIMLVAVNSIMLVAVNSIMLRK